MSTITNNSLYFSQKPIITLNHEINTRTFLSKFVKLDFIYKNNTPYFIVIRIYNDSVLSAHLVCLCEVDTLFPFFLRKISLLIQQADKQRVRRIAPVKQSGRPNEMNNTQN